MSASFISLTFTSSYEARDQIEILDLHLHSNLISFLCNRTHCCSGLFLLTQPDIEVTYELFTGLEDLLRIRRLTQLHLVWIFLHLLTINDEARREPEDLHGLSKFSESCA